MREARGYVQAPPANRSWHDAPAVPREVAAAARLPDDGAGLQRASISDGEGGGLGAEGRHGDGDQSDTSLKNRAANWRLCGGILAGESHLHIRLSIQSRPT